MYTPTFWKDAAERAISTAAQAAIGVLTAGSIGLVDIDWASTGSIAGLAAVVSLLKSIVASGIGNGDASLVDTAGSGRHAA
ncbi:hypothetical protein BIV04_03245 [Frigoribacterium sp. MCBA15_019]|nr:hypothetical protein BIV04_03245 [Frigoribacterium sp. MCBA15_019]